MRKNLWCFQKGTYWQQNKQGIQGPVQDEEVPSSPHLTSVLLLELAAWGEDTTSSPERDGTQRRWFKDQGPSASWVPCSKTGGMGSLWRFLSLNILHLFQIKLLHSPPESKVPPPPFSLFSYFLLSNNCIRVWRNRTFQKLLAGTKCFFILLPVISSPFSSLWRPAKRRSWRRTGASLTLWSSIWSSGGHSWAWVTLSTLAGHTQWTGPPNCKGNEHQSSSGPQIPLAPCEVPNLPPYPQDWCEHPWRMRSGAGGKGGLVCLRLPKNSWETPKQDGDWLLWRRNHWERRLFLIETNCHYKESACTRPFLFSPPLACHPRFSNFQSLTFLTCPSTVFPRQTHTHTALPSCFLFSSLFILTPCPPPPLHVLTQFTASGIGASENVR